MFNAQDIKDMERIVKNAKGLQDKTSNVGWQILLAQVIEVLSHVVVNAKNATTETKKSNKKSEKPLLS